MTTHCSLGSEEQSSQERERQAIPAGLPFLPALTGTSHTRRPSVRSPALYGCGRCLLGRGLLGQSPAFAPLGGCVYGARGVSEAECLRKSTWQREKERERPPRCPSWGEWVLPARFLSTGVELQSEYQLGIRRL